MKISDYITNKPLRRLIERHIGKDAEIPEEYTLLFGSINSSFEHLENDRLMMERSMELSSTELIQANTRLREEAEQSKILLRKLQESLIALGLFDSSMTDMDLLTVAGILRKQIDQRIEAEKQSADALRRTQQIIDTSLDAIIISDEEGRIIGWSNAAQSIFGWSYDEVVGKHVTETVIPPRFAPIVSHSLVQYRQTQRSTILGKRIEITATNSQGKSFPIELTITAIDTGQGSLFTSFIRDISERKQVEQNLVEAKLQAESANRAKSAFLSSMSHELRTPLNSIIGFAQILMKERSIPEQQRGFLQIMYNSSNHLLDMINDILDITKIEAGQMELTTDSVDLYALVKEVEESLRMRSLSKGLRLSVDIDANIPRYILIDGKRLKQVLFNLISNSIKFTASGGITIYLQYKDSIDHSYSQLVLIVEDTGRGIPPEQLNTIFQPFKQVNGMYSEGTGLGLAICSRIISMMNGRISVNSTVGMGSRFLIEIPIITVESSPSMPVSLPATYHRIKGSKQPTVLIVDDIQNNRIVARIILEAIGFICYEAADGIEAVDVNRRIHPDIILMDLRMPRMDGKSAMKSIRAERGDTLPIIALTASGFDGKRDSLIAEGFSEYVRKPFREEDLLYVLEHTAGVEFEHQSGSENNTGEEGGIYSDITAFINDMPEGTRQDLLDALQVQNLNDMEDILHSLGDIAPRHRAALTQLLHAVESFDVGMLIRLSEFYI